MILRNFVLQVDDQNRLPWGTGITGMVRDGSRDDSRPGVEGSHDPFGSLASAVRVEILVTLSADPSPLSYAELFEATSADDRGRFNYHLRKLRDEFVRKTDDGYELTQRGRWSTNLVAASVLQEGDDRPFRGIDSTCGRCGGDAVEMGYRDGEGIVRCTDCETHLVRFDFPPGAVRNRSLGELVTAFATRTREYVALADEGVCPFCSNETTAKIDPGAATDPDGLPVVYDCRFCSARIRSPLGLSLATRPELSAKLVDSGRNLRTTPFWEFEWCTFVAPAVHETTPIVARIELPLGDDTGRVLVNEDVEVVEVDR